MSKKQETVKQEPEVTKSEPIQVSLPTRSVIDIKKLEPRLWLIQELVVNSADSVVEVKEIGRYDSLSESINVYKMAIGKHLSKVLEGVI